MKDDYSNVQKLPDCFRKFGYENMDIKIIITFDSETIGMSMRCLLINRKSKVVK